MRVLLVRHGEAIDPNEADSDSLRTLTASGRRTVRSVAELLAAEGLAPSRIFTSPLVRAVQTAEILALGTAFADAVEVWPALASGPTARALGALEEATADATVVLVGHEPLIRTMAAQLIGHPGLPGFRTGMAFLVSRPDASAPARFEWAVNPRALQRIDRLDDLG